MLNIIKSDLYRIFKGKSIYIAIIIILGLSFLSICTISPGHIGLSVSNQTVDSTKYDAETLEKINDTNSLTELRKIMKENGRYELDKDIIGTNINLYYVLIVVVFIIICSDFSNSSIKNTLTSAISRKKYYFSKLFLCLGLGTVIILLNTYFTFFINLLINGSLFSSGILEVTKITLMQLPLLLGLISILVCIGFITKKTAIFNSISIPFVLITQMLIYGAIALFRIKDTWFLDYEIQFALENLASNPAIEYIIRCGLLGIAYVIIFNIIGYYSFKKAEIK